MIKPSLLLVLSLLAVAAFSQETKPETDCANFTGFAIESKIGALNLNFDRLNEALAANNVAIFDEPALRLSFAFRTRNTKGFTSIIGFEILHGMDMDKSKVNIDNSTRTTRNFIGYGLFSEYDIFVFRKKAIEIYPSFGFGFERSSLRITDNIPLGFNFPNSIHSTAITRKYSTWDMFADMNLNLKLKFPMLGALYHVGVYGGYRADLLDSEWKMDENVPILFPKLTMNGWQWGIIIGAELDCERMKKYRSKREDKNG